MTGFNDTAHLLNSLAEDRILILDGAMGTMIQQHGFDEAAYRGTRFLRHESDLLGNNDLLSLTQPEFIKSIHDDFLEAGADIVTTNTFNANAVSQQDYGLEALSYELNLAAARLADSMADEWTALTPLKPRFVAGAIGPTNMTASISPDVTDPSLRRVDFDTLVAAYRDACRGLVDGGADLILIETIFDTLNAKAAIYAVRTVFEETGRELPIMISGTITDRSGRTLTGPDAGSLLDLGRTCRPLQRRIELRAGRSANAPAHCRAFAGSGRPDQRLPQRRIAERVGGVR